MEGEVSLHGWNYEIGHVINVLKRIPNKTIQCVVTSPPYPGASASTKVSKSKYGVGMMGVQHGRVPSALSRPLKCMLGIPLKS